MVRKSDTMKRIRPYTLVIALLLAFASSLMAAEPAAGPATYTLTGKITDQAGQPLEDVRVGLRTAGGETHTDAQGEFTLTVSATRPLSMDNTKTYDAVELDKDGFMGRSIDIRDLALFEKPLNEKLLPYPVSDDKAEFTRRMSLDHLLPAISPNKEFDLISADQWRKFFAGMDGAKKGGRTEQVVFQAYIPKGVSHLKAAFLLTRHGIGSVDHPRLRDFANRNQVALVSVKGNPVQRGFYPVSLIDGDVARLGQMLKHPELGQLPVVVFGHSNGTGFSGIFASQRPERVIAWISYHSGAAWHLQFPGVEKVPGLALHGLIDPFLKNGQEATVKHLRQERNAPLALMLEGNVAHGPVDKDQNATWDFIAAFAEAAMRIRLNADGTLRPVVIEQGWVGANYNVSQGGQQELAIAPYAEFKGDRAIANWLPDQTFAEVWQRYGKTDPRPAPKGIK